MTQDKTEGCPRCQDYDKIKDELEGSKRKSQEEQKSALKRCEDSKAKLQKKLITAGAVALIAGTILGKDFIDQVASYIDSFNKVKDTASGLVGMATPAPTPEPETKQEDPPKEEEKDEEETPEKREFSPAPPFTKLVSADTGSIYRPTLDFADIAMLSTNYDPFLMESMNILDMIEQSPPLSISDLINDMTILDPPFVYPVFDIFEETPVSAMSMNNAPVVPEAHSFVPLAFAPFFLRSRRRNV